MSQEGTTFDLPPQSSRPRPLRATVTLVAPAGTHIIELTPGEEISVGRSSSCSIPIRERGVSRLQATLRYDGRRAVTVTDHGSRNGTFVDGRRIDGSQRVGSGSEIRVGDSRLLLAIPSVRPNAKGKDSDDDTLIAGDPAMMRALELADRAGGSDMTILIVGETGVGKEVIARRIHGLSGRASGPFVAVNCGAIVESLAESTLFGHEKGAFTGAQSRAVGLFEAAGRGTLLLDEVGELSLAMQSRLLRVLEERVVKRVGGTEDIPVDVRVLGATHRDLGQMVEKGSFRQDLFYRLNALSIPIPPLRERPDDIALLAEHFVTELAPDARVRLGTDAIEVLRNYKWPGNVRELRNALGRSLALRQSDVLTASSFADLGKGNAIAYGGALKHRVTDTERQAIVEAMRLCNDNQTRVAKRLGISRRALIHRLEKYALKKPARKRGQDNSHD